VIASEISRGRRRVASYDSNHGGLVEKARRWLCGSLIVFTIVLNFKHVWDVLTLSPEMRTRLSATFANETLIVAILSTGVVACCLFLFRRTYLAGCLLQAAAVVAIAGLQIYSGHAQASLLEIPFLLCVGMMIYLGYPFPEKT
jgi:hypothetical protein